MGLRRRELALASVVRRVRGPQGTPGTAPKPAAGAAPALDFSKAANSQYVPVIGA